MTNLYLLLCTFSQLFPLRFVFVNVQVANDVLNQVLINIRCFSFLIFASLNQRYFLCSVGFDLRDMLLRVAIYKNSMDLCKHGR
jgi:hypothetical protein